MKAIVLGKVAGLALVLGLLLWGLGEISGLVQERQGQRQAAVASVAQSLAGAQTLLGPVVHMACTEEWQTREGRDGVVTARREFTRVAPPATLTVDGGNQLEPRARGLHTTQVFTLKTHIRAEWPNLEALKVEREHAGSRISCGPALIALSVSDARGIRQAVLQVNGAPQTARSGTFMGAYPRGVHSPLPASTDLAAPLKAELELELLGTERLGIVPLGGATQVTLRSNWPHPSFNGQFLPSDRTVTDEGFDASWRVSALSSTAQRAVQNQRPLCDGSGEREEPTMDSAVDAARNAAAAVTSASVVSVSGPTGSGCTETLGVAFIDPSNTYALSHRATRYGLLFIALTFVAVGLFEFLRSLRVHPVQYFLVGAAVSIFFLLLVSLSEHLAFGSAYALAATACVLLLTWYASHMLRSWRSGLPFGAGIAALYALLYVLLRLEQTALLVGAVALFAVLALVMLLTRKVDWYSRLQVGGAPTSPTTPRA